MLLLFLLYIGEILQVLVVVLSLPSTVWALHELAKYCLKLHQMDLIIVILVQDREQILDQSFVEGYSNLFEALSEFTSGHCARMVLVK